MSTKITCLILSVVLLDSAESSATCRDAPGWTNLDGLCAEKDGGKVAEWCAVRPGLAYPATLGWTCEYYRKIGWCKNGFVSAEGAKEMGPFKNWPERYCCGCAPLPDTSCNDNTGKSCSQCGSALGPVECKNDTCKCQSGYCASSAGTCSLYKPASAEQESMAADSSKCVDTPGWANLWSGCAWQAGGKNASLCRPTPGANWPSTAGWTCEYYRTKGLCQNGEVKFASGSLHNYPEMNCCGCAKAVQTACNVNTGHCGTSSGFCSLQVDEAVEQSLITMYKDVITDGGNQKNTLSAAKTLDTGRAKLAIAGLAAVSLGMFGLLLARRVRDKRTFNGIASDEELEEM